MNPAMMSYWLSQLQQPAPGIGLGQQMEPLQMPGVPEMGMPPEMPEERPSPISRGASAGMEAARQSMALSGEQRSRAFGHGLMAFSGNMNRAKHGEGFAGTLGAINEALNPALQAYVNRQDKEREMNAELLKRQDLLERQAREEALMEKRYQQTEALRRDQMAETAAYRNAMLDLKREQIAAKNGTNAPQYSEEGFDLSGYAPITNKNMLNLYSKDKKVTAKILKEIGEIKKLDEDFGTLTKENVFDPNNPYTGKEINAVKDFVGYQFGNKALQSETTARKKLNSKLGEFQINAENALRGGGVLGKGLIKVFADMDIYPKVDEPKYVRDAKMNAIEEKMKNLYGAANASVKYNRQIDPLDYEQMQQLFEGKDEPEVKEETAELAVADEKAKLRAEEQALLRKAGAR